MNAKILLISNGFQPNYEKGFANGLARNGVAVVLVASDRTQEAALDPGIELLRLRGSQDPSRPPVQKLVQLVRYVARLLWLLLTTRYRAVHLIGLFVTASVWLGLVEVLLYKLLSRRLVFTVHNLLPHGQHTATNRWLLRRIYGLADLLVVHTTRMRDALVREWGIPAVRIVHMEHGVDDLPSQWQVPAPRGKGPLRLLMFGSVVHYKGVDIALEALTLLREPPIQLTIAGQVRDRALERTLEEAIARVPSVHQVHWQRGFVAESDVQALFEQADAALLPYRHIDQSGVLFTAYRFGTPVVAFDVGAFSRYVPPQVGVIVKDRSAQGLARCLQELAHTLSGIRRDDVRRYASLHVWEHTVHALLPHY